MVLLIPYTDPARVQRARFLLAEVQGYAPLLAPTAMLHAATRITAQQWEHYVTHLSIRSQIRDGTWACVRIPQRSEWCTLMLYGSETYLFNRAGAVCFFPAGAVKDRTLYRGTVLAGDFASEAQGEVVVFTFRVVHALVVRGNQVAGIPLALRVKAAAGALDGLRRHCVGHGEWRFELAPPALFHGFRKDGQDMTRTRLLHAHTTPDASLLWALELP